MADNSMANDLMISLGGAISAQANRPQKTSSTITSTPLQLADMLARRNSIGANSANLANMLKLREGGMYGLANSLSNLPGAQSEGTGAGLLNFAKAFGGAYNSRANAMMDNAQKQYDASRADLADALMFDKAMGEQQSENIGYTAPAGAAGVSTGAKDLAMGTTLADVYATIEENPMLNSALGRQMAISEDANAKQQFIDAAMTDIASQEMERMRDLMPKGFAGAINTATEMEKMMPLLVKYNEARGSTKKAVIRDIYSRMWDSANAQAIQLGVRPVKTKDEFISEMLASGKAFRGPNKLTDIRKEVASKKQEIPVGTIKNGIRFDGVDSNGKKKFTKVQ